MNTNLKTFKAGSILVLSALWAGCGGGGVQQTPNAPSTSTVSPASQDWADKFEVSQKHLVTDGKNPFFILEPGYQLLLKGEDEGSSFELTITVLNETKNLAGFMTRVIEERETRGGQVVEVSRNFFSIDRNTKAVYYLGEDVDLYKDGKVTGHDGSWAAGRDGAKLGMAMPGAPAVGEKFYQEMAPNVAMDRAEIVSLNETITTPAGTFTNCLKTRETNALKPTEEEFKFYAPGIGLVKEEELLLVKYGNADHP